MRHDMIGEKAIKNKIKMVKNIKKITNAMKMIALFKMRKIQKKSVSSSSYHKTIERIVKNFIFKNLNYVRFFLERKNIKTVGIIVISTDRGLVSGLNTFLFKKILEKVKDLERKNIRVKLFLIGLKAISFFSSIEVDTIETKQGITEKSSISKFYEMTQTILESYQNLLIDKFYIAKNSFLNTLSQKVQFDQLLPFSFHNLSQKREDRWDYLYEPNKKTIRNNLFFRYFSSKIYQNVVENLISEQVARMMTMKAASENSSNLIEELQKTFNKSKQDAITREIIEIVSGINKF